MSNNNEATPKYRIHPGIGIARLGDSPSEFCISPEKPTALPIDCDEQGNSLLSDDGESEIAIAKFKDSEGRIKRQAARFKVYVYDDQSPEGRPLKLGDPIKGGGNEGVLVDIQWQVYLANKKAVWYEFNALQGEHGYSQSHPRRNADITDPEARQRLIIDPGPQVVNVTNRRTAYFNKDHDDLYAPTFPPPLKPHSIETLGELKTDNQGRLIVLGGHGNSGTAKSGFGHPRIEGYANNDGWFDDTSDGSVMARLVMYSENVDQHRFIDVEYPAWVIVGYPAYVPEILDVVTLDDVIYDMAIREFAYRTDLYGKAGTFKKPEQIDTSDLGAIMHWKRGRLQWNPHYMPWFYRDIWPILFRADEMTHLTNVLEQSNFPHNQTERGNIDPDKLSVPPIVNHSALQRQKRELVQKNQSGELWLESLGVTFTLFDEQLKTKSPGFNQGFINKALNDWESLKEKATVFAQTLASLAQEYYGEEDSLGQSQGGDKYLKRWQEIQDQEAGNNNGFKQRCEEAKQTLKDEVNDILDDLLARVNNEFETDVVSFLRRPSSDRKETSRPAASLVEFSRQLKKFITGQLLEECFKKAKQDCTYDPYKNYRRFLFDLLRQPDEENEFRLGGKPKNRTFNLPLMPLLAGDNPLTNNVPSKFLRLTDYQLYLLRQWAEGKFYNEVRECWVKPEDVDVFQPYKNWTNKTAHQLDRGVLMNLLGGAFCPGGEVGWNIRNPAIYKEPYRIKADPDFSNFPQTAAQANANRIPAQDYTSSISAILSQDNNLERGLQPGDLTKHMALPWQADFNECTTQPINITYDQWNRIEPDSENDPWMKLEEQVWDTLWWPAHRPLQTYEVVAVNNGSPSYEYLNWSRGVPQTNAGDLKMVSEWSKLGFVVRNPYLSEEQLNQPSPGRKYISVERTEEESGDGEIGEMGS